MPGKEVIVERLTNDFETFSIHYTEKFKIIAFVGENSMQPIAGMEGQQFDAISTFIRTYSQ